MMKRKLMILLLLVVFSSPVFAVGLFDMEADWALDSGTKIAGSAVEADGVYTLMGNGDDIWNTDDEGFYLYTEKPATESWVLSGKVEWVDHGTNDWAKIGPMIRGDADLRSSAHLGAALRGANDLLQAFHRDVNGRPTTEGRYADVEAQAEIAVDGAPVYLRVGYWAPMNVQYAEASLDGINWTHICSTSIDRGDTLAYGFAITNHENNDFLAEGKVSEVVFEQLAAAPSFIDQGAVGEFENHMSVGSFFLPGDASFDGTTYTVTGVGSDIWGDYDRFHYVYKNMTGAFEAEVNVFPLEPSTNSWNKGGLMVRDSLASGSPQVMAMLRSGSADVEWGLQYRASKSFGSGDAPRVPLSDRTDRAKIVKLGSLVQIYTQDFDNQWILTGEANIEIGDECLLGLAVTSHENWQYATYEFSDLQITEYPFFVERQLSDSTYKPGQVIDVVVKADVREGQTISALSIQETVPAEAMDILDISDGGTLVDGVITWNLTNLTADQELSYKVVAPEDINIAKIIWGEGTSTGAGLTLAIGGPSDMSAISFNAYATFSYPSNDNANTYEGESIDGRDGGFGWGADNPWVTSENVVLNVDTLDAGLVQSQPTEYNPGNYSAQLIGEVQAGLSRRLPTVMDGGELWVSYTFKEEGPAADHWSGMTLFNDQGSEVSFVGKPYNAEFCGIGNLPGGDQVSGVPYQEANHILVRFAIKGNDSVVSMWVNPDKEDRVDTADVTGADEINNIAEFRLRRGGATGSAYYDNIWISSVPALPPAGAGRVDLQIDNPDRPAGLPAWDVISIDQFDDALTGVQGYGHDVGEDHYLIVGGFIYFPDITNLDQQIVAPGLPVDRMSGLNGHIFGNYNNAFEGLGLKNAMKFENNAEQSGPFTFDVVPAGNYQELRSAQTVANGDGQLICTLIYEDGTTEDSFLHADDWYNDGGEIQFLNTRQMVDGMDRLAGGDSNYQNSSDPAIFECFIDVNPSKVLTQVTLQFDPSVTAGAAYNLFDIWAVPAAEVTPGVDDWQLF